MRDAQNGALGSEQRCKRICMAMFAVALVGCCAALALTGCQPADAQSESDTVLNEDRVTYEGTFTERDAGAWGDTQYATAMNADNRGCNACHDDLFDVLPTGNVGSHEVYKEAACGKVYTYIRAMAATKAAARRPAAAARTWPPLSTDITTARPVSPKNSAVTALAAMKSMSLKTSLACGMF